MFDKKIIRIGGDFFLFRYYNFFINAYTVEHTSQKELYNYQFFDIYFLEVVVVN
jgi:hypothetical protein